MSGPIPPHVERWAGLSGPMKVLAQARARIERGRCGPRAVLDLSLSKVERDQVGAVLDARWALGSEPVRVADLRAGLAAHQVILEDLLESLGGPLRDLRAERAALRETWEADRGRARAILLELDPDLPPEVLDRCLAGVPSVERAQAIRRVVEAISIEGERLPVLAARLFGDAHALDRSRPLGRAVARFLSGSLVEASGGSWRDPVGDSLGWREAWASRGIACDEVSAQVLVLNLPLTGQAPAVSLSSQTGEPVWLTLRSLRGGVRLADGVADVFVCENPSIVEAAADRFGANSRPLVCTFGIPSLAAHTLLRSLAGQARLHVRADEDAVGRRIVTQLLQLPGSQPWPMLDDGLRYEEEILAGLLADLAPGE